MLGEAAVVATAAGADRVESPVRGRAEVEREARVDWSLLCMALGLALVIEGAPYFLFPERLGALLKQLERVGPRALRTLGFMIMLTGVALLLLGRSLR